MRSRFVRSLLLLATAAIALEAHVGSPDIYLDGKAGPYQLFVTVRPPLVIPGVADIEIRSETAGVDEIRVVPIPMTGPGARFAPVPDKLKRSAADPQFFTGSLWMMASGSWQVRVTADGPQGEGVLAVPVPAVALTAKKMERPLGVLLGLVGLFLVAGVVAMAGASVREARLAPGVLPDAYQRTRARIAMATALLIVTAVVWYGNAWWNSEARSFRERIYKPLEMKGSVDDSGTLTLRMSDPGWFAAQPVRLKLGFFVRTIDDLIPDHDHLMHLYAIREPGLDVVYHLHPELIDTGVFKLKLPSMPAGKYKLYADIVHANGFPETMATTLDLLQPLNGRPLAGDDAKGTAAPWQQASTAQTVFALPDGYRMEWLRGTQPLKAKDPAMFQFRLTTARGVAPGNMRLYMGMLGHAAFVKTDGMVFAHIHPQGSVSMAALMLAQNQTRENMNGMDMSSMNMPGMEQSAIESGALPNEVSFPYGFPLPGRYRIYVQMKHGNTIETGIFDVDVQ